jgi:hypothetical protein
MRKSGGREKGEGGIPSLHFGFRSELWMRKEIKDYSASQFLILITWDCVNLFVFRPEDNLIRTEGVENEEQCVQVLEIFINRRVQDLSEHLHKLTAASVCTLTEVGIWDWENCKRGTVFVSAITHNPTLDHGIYREMPSKGDQRFAIKYF